MNLGKSINNNKYNKLFKESNFSTLLLKPTLPTLYTTKELFKYLIEEKERILLTRSYNQLLKKNISAKNKEKETITFFRDRVATNSILYKNNIYLQVLVSLNLENEITIFIEQTNRDFYKNLKININSINNIKNTNNFILYDSRDLQVVIVSEDKYNEMGKYLSNSN